MNYSRVVYFLWGVFVGVGGMYIFLFGLTDMASYNYGYTYSLRRSPNTNSSSGVDTSVADEMFRKVKILCIVMTHPENHEKKAIYVKKTWGRKCNELIFMSTKEDPTLPAIKLPVREDREYLWGKTKGALNYVYQHYRNKVDWFLKADDDSYVVMENLRYLLSSYDTRKPLYFGCRMHDKLQGYMSGGAGYVLSYRALDLFVNRFRSIPHHCMESDNSFAEDLKLGACLYYLGVKAVDTRDEFEKNRFFPFRPESFLNPFHTYDWFDNYTYYNQNRGLDCCSNLSVSFHYMDPAQMYLMEYLLYGLRPYGVHTGFQDTVPLGTGRKHGYRTNN